MKRSQGLLINENDLKWDFKKKKHLVDLFMASHPHPCLIISFSDFQGFFSDRFRHREVPNKLARHPHTEKERENKELPRKVQGQVQFKSLLQTL